MLRSPTVLQLNVKVLATVRQPRSVPRANVLPRRQNIKKAFSVYFTTNAPMNIGKAENATATKYLLEKVLTNFASDSQYLRKMFELYGR